MDSQKTAYYILLPVRQAQLSYFNFSDSADHFAGNEIARPCSAQWKPQELFGKVSSVFNTVLPSLWWQCQDLHAKSGTGACPIFNIELKNYLEQISCVHTMCRGFTFREVQGMPSPLTTSFFFTKQCMWKYADIQTVKDREKLCPQPNLQPSSTSSLTSLPLSVQWTFSLYFFFLSLN